MAESAEEVFGGFEGELRGFPESGGIIQTVRIVFFVEDMARLVEETCDAGKGI